MDSTFISCADTAKLLRAALKKGFPGVKFSVRSKTYSMGASITVVWTDGPTAQLVEAVARKFSGSGFDGMIDMKYSKQHWLMPDGSVAIAHSEGTEGSKGTVPAVREWMPNADAKLVHFGADYVFCERKFSPAFIAQACARLVRKGFQQFAEVEIDPGYSTAFIKNSHRRVNDDDTTDMGTLLRRECYSLMVVS